MGPRLAHLSQPGWWRLGMGAAYGVVGVLIAVGAAPIWCLGVLLTLPAAFRVVRTSADVPLPEDADIASHPDGVWRWLLAFGGQLFVGYAIAWIAR